MKNLIVGAGEVGRSLFEVLSQKHETFLKDKEDLVLDGIEILNICFPYSEYFDDELRKYQEYYKPKITVIHSTVPVGTSRKLGALHSPIHGKHPDLSKGIKTFKKFVGGTDKIQVRTVVKFLKEAGIKAKTVSSPEVSELSKILCTTYYGWNIIFQKEVAKLCEQFGVPFDETYGWNRWYNKGYRQMGMSKFCRPVLENVPGKIGGHCVVQNTRLLDSFITKVVKEYDEAL